MNILFFNRSFYPDVEATGRFLAELCEDLIQHGHKVTVVAGKSHYTKEKKIKSDPGRDNYQSKEIIRVSGTQLPKRFLLFRLINLGTYFLFAFIAGFIIKNKPNIVVAQTEPPVMGLLGYFFSKWYKAKFIYSCKDIYPEIGIITGELKNPLLNYLLEKINLFSFENADKVICLGSDMKKVIVSKGTDERKISIIHDWADTKNLYPIPSRDNPFRVKYDLSDNFTIMYSGNIGLTQGLEKIIKIANYFKDRKRLKFIIVGEGANKIKLQNMVSALSLNNANFLPYQPTEELKFSLSAPDIHLITFEKGLAGMMVPSKVYGILACGKPFIAWIDKESEISYIAENYKCGVVVPAGDEEGLIKAIEWACDHPKEIENMGKNSRRAAIEQFDRKISTSKYNQCFYEVVAQ